MELSPQVWHGKKNVAKRMLKFFAKGDKSAGSALARLLLAVQAYVFSKGIDPTEAFVVALPEELDRQLRSRSDARFAAFRAAVAMAEADDAFDILACREDNAAFMELRDQLGAGNNPPAVNVDALAPGTTEDMLLVALNGAREGLADTASGAGLGVGEVDADVREEDARFDPLGSLLDFDVKAAMKAELEALVGHHRDWRMERRLGKKNPTWAARRDGNPAPSPSSYPTVVRVSPPRLATTATADHITLHPTLP